MADPEVPFLPISNSFHLQPLQHLQQERAMMLLTSTSPTIGSLSKQLQVSPFDKNQGGENTHQQKIEENLLSNLPLVSYVPYRLYTQL